MQNRYNLEALESLFRSFLEFEKISPITIKNYLSDIRHFFGWTLFYVESQNITMQENMMLNLVSYINEGLIDTYRDYLTSNTTPLKTANRRLSSLRKFCSFCIKQGWMVTNPAKKIGNLSDCREEIVQKNKDVVVSPPSTHTPEQAIDEYASELKKKLVDDSEIRLTLSDISEFLSISNHPSL